MAISDLDPKRLWKNFYELTRIPRPSHHEEKIQNYMYNFGQKLGLETIRDEVGNIIIRKPATPGMENRKGVILQGHLDMVPQKNSDKDHDFLNDPIAAYVDGDWVTANGTTLGADNGMGVAAAMTVLESNDLQHGPVEALFTSTEETGMNGAFGLKAGVLKGDILLNLDSEEEGELYVGCAGGEDVNVHFSYTPEPVPGKHIAFVLGIKGLRGGHSGMDIVLQRGNANKIFFRLLNEAYKKAEVRLASIEGGNLRNAIPREAFAVVTVAEDMQDHMRNALENEFDLIKEEYKHTEPNIQMVIEESELPKTLIDESTQLKVTKSVLVCPNGVIWMSHVMPGLVETSSNLAVVRSNEEDQSIQIFCLMRSSVDSAKENLGRRIKSLFSLSGACVSFTGAYPGWNPDMDSPILKLMQEIYKNKFGSEPKIRAIHAGLECGLLGATYPNWDMISFGPTIQSPHSPDERVNIQSVSKFWDFLVEVLSKVPEKK